MLMILEIILGILGIVVSEVFYFKVALKYDFFDMSVEGVKVKGKVKKRI